MSVVPVGAVPLATDEDLSEQELTLLHKTFSKKAEDTLRHLEAKRGRRR